MVYEIEDMSKAEKIFTGWEETLIYSCIQKVMGKIYVTDNDEPQSAFAFIGRFGFFAGKPERELVKNIPEGFVILVPQNEAWEELIEDVYPDAKKMTRYAIRKDTQFDTVSMRNNLLMLPEGYELKEIDDEIYDKCLKDPVTKEFVSLFESKEKYLKDGRGMVILKNGEIVSGASSYSRYREGIEIEVDTIESERRKNLALIVCSALILRCLNEGLYPSWDAQNMGSVHLAEKLGYEFDHTYVAYEVASDMRTH
ncbi:MAG: GNAT family N-acetyltransferase [Eubacterium sp.]|nr:GNAT family N-acetyltransferase [Eubacterium sp.]